MIQPSNRAVGFERVSSNKQFQEGCSLESYRNKIDFFANKFDYKIDRHFPFVATSVGQDQEILDDEKHYIQQIIHYCMEHNIPNIMIPSIQRITRSGAKWYLYLKEKIDDAGLTLIDTENVIQPKSNSLEYLGFGYDWSSYSPSASSEIQAAEDAKKDHHDLLTKLIGAEIEYVAKGYPMGQPLLGFKSQKTATNDGLRVVWVSDDHYSKFVKMWFELLATGYDWQTTVDKVNQAGFLSKKKIRWQTKLNGEKFPVGNIKTKPLTVKQLQRYVKNPRYAGFLKEKWTKGKLIKGFIEPLVSIEVFNKANKGLTQIIRLANGDFDLIHNLKNSSRCEHRLKNNPAYPCKFMPCPKCGKTLYGSAGKNKNGKHVGHYHCARGHKYWGINKNQFHQTLFNYIDTLKLSPSFINLFRIVLGEVWQEKQNDRLVATATIQSKINDLEAENQAQIKKISVVSLPSVITELEKQIDSTSNEILLLQRQLEENNTDTALEFDKLFNHCAKYLEHPKEYLEGLDNNPNQRFLLELFFNQPPTPDDIVNRTPKLAELYQLNQYLDSSKEQIVTPVGVEPTITWMKARCPRPLDDGAVNDK